MNDSHAIMMLNYHATVCISNHCNMNPFEFVLLFRLNDVCGDDVFLALATCDRVFIE